MEPVTEIRTFIIDQFFASSNLLYCSFFDTSLIKRRQLIHFFPGSSSSEDEDVSDSLPL